MSYSELTCFRVETENAVARVMIDHAPINLMDVSMMSELYKLAKLLAADASVKVIVVRSADPDFFIAHADLATILTIREQPMDPDRLSIVNKAVELFRSMPKVSIAVIEGQAQGGGSELALGMDMRFAVLGRARLGQPEAALGIIPGSGGCVRLPKLMGRGRALEVLLGSRMFSAEEAERYGWVNRALPADEIDAYVDGLAHRIASLPEQVIASIKTVVNDADSATMETRLLAEQAQFSACAQSDEGQRRMARALQLGAQQREVELDEFDTMILNLADS